MNHDRLAIDGGAPLLPKPPPPWPRPSEAVRAALLATYEDGSWGKYHAGHVERLEQALATMHGAAQALVCASGTFAVELALRALKIGAGDEVVLAGYDFPGNFRAIEAVGARPVLVDIEPQTWCLDVEQCEAALTPETKAVIVSHLHGGIADLQSLRSICDARGVAIVEDACQTPGGQVQGRIAGAWGDVGVLSFGGSKLLTAGRGGAIITSDPQVAQRAKIFCERGNHAFPLSELQAAVLLPQLSSLAEQNAIRQQRVRQLLELLAAVDGLAPLDAWSSRGISGFYKVAWRFTGDHARWRSREALLCALQAEGVPLDAGFRGFAGRTASRCRRLGDLAHSRAAAEQTVLLHHPILLQDKATIDALAAAMLRVLQAN